MAGPSSVDEYLAEQPPRARAALEHIRAAIKSAAPEATEGISYKMPTFKLNGRAFIWFAGFKDHLSLYPYTERLLEELGEELRPHVSGKGTLRFDADEPIPVDLVKRIVAVRLKETETAYRRR